MKPALTPEEWAAFPNWPDAPRPMFNGDAPLYYPTKHGIAAANLHGLVVDGKPVGFTWSDVRACWWAADGMNSHELRLLGDKIRALLPPEVR